MRFGAIVAVLIGLAIAVGGARAQATQSVTYDALGRVTSVITTDGKQTIYSYDAAGNRTTVVVSSSAITPPTAADQSISYTYGNAPPGPIDPSLAQYVTIVGVTPAQLGTTSFTSTSLTYTPPATAVGGTDHFGYEVKDSRTGLTASAVVTVTLIIGSPIANPDNVTAAQNSFVQFDPRVNDSDPNHLALTITAVTTPSHGTAVINSGTSITYTPTIGFWCTSFPKTCDTFNYTITDTANHSASAAANVTVTALGPTASPVSMGTAENRNVTFDPRIYDSDPQSLPLTVTAVGTPSHGTASITGGSMISYTPTSNYTGADSFSYTVTNSGGGAASGTVTMSVGAALAVQVSATSWSWLKSENNPPVLSPPIIGTATGGQGPYAYAWQFVSGFASSALSPNSYSTQWTGSPRENNIQYTAYWQLQVTDSANTVANGPQVTVTFEWDNSQCVRSPAMLSP